MFLGPDLVPFLILAFGGAMLVGNVTAMARRRPVPRREGEMERAPLCRTLPYALIGLVATVWAIASLVSF